MAIFASAARKEAKGSGQATPSETKNSSEKRTNSGRETGWEQEEWRLQQHRLTERAGRMQPQQQQCQ